MTKPLRVLFAVVIVAGITVSSSFAATVPLSDLLDGGEFVSGNKTFSDFSYTTKPDSDMPSADGVTVTDIPDGIRFQGAFIDQAGGDASDVLITFNVSVPDGAPPIYRATMAANPAVFNGPGLASVTETFLPEVNDDKIVIYDFGGGDDKLSESILFDPNFSTLSVQKDLILHAMDGGAVTMSFIDQTFEQIPEPSSLILLMGGLLGLGVLRRRKR